MADKRETEVHESGHAVAHIRFGILQDRVTIVQKDGNMGSSISAGLESVWSKEAAADMVLAYCAGYAAMVAAGYSDADARAGCADDFDKATELVSRWGLPGDLEEWVAQTADLMRRPENVAAVALIAEHLMQHETLDDQYLDVLVDVADGKCTEAEFAQFLQFREQLRKRGSL